MNPLVLVNARHAYPERVPNLVAVGDSPVLLEQEAAREMVRRGLVLEEYLT